jgi:hypothetical protein
MPLGRDFKRISLDVETGELVMGSFLFERVSSDAGNERYGVAGLG